MKRLALIYILLGTAYSMVAAVLEWFPADMVTAWVGGLETKLQFVLILCGTFLHVLIPLIVFFVVWNLTLTTRKKRIPLGEGAVVTIQRDKSVFRSFYPLDILIDGERMTSIPFGGKRQILLEEGTYELCVKSPGFARVQQQVQMKRNEVKVFTTGFRLNGSALGLYVDELQD